MAKGLFSQGVCLLTDGRTTIGDIKSALQAGGYKIVKETPAQEEWRFGGPTVVTPFIPEVNGYAAIDVVNHAWPDSMGDPKSDPMTFAAWSMGNFGPFAFPGGLARAGQHSWSWSPGKTIAQAHRGFIRLRISYGFGAKDDDPVLPKAYDPLAELRYLSKLTLAVMNAAGVLCYFNPNGEVLRDRDSYEQVLVECDQQDKIPLPLWMNIRFFKLNESLFLMDTVGNGQLELQDVEAVFPGEKYDPSAVDNYLRNVTQYLLGLHRPLRSGETIDGPGETNLSWTIDALEQGAVDPPRGVLRLCPKSNYKEIQQVLSAIRG
jgi:hypothetical protein